MTARVLCDAQYHKNWNAWRREQKGGHHLDLDQEGRKENMRLSGELSNTSN